MIMDSQNEFSDGQAVTTDAISDVLDLIGGTSPNAVIDLGQIDGPIYLVVQVHTTFDSSGDTATLAISLESDSTENLATAPTVHIGPVSFAQAALVAGATLMAVALPFGEYQRYLGMRWNNGTEAFTAGKISAFLVKDVQKWKSYADAVDKILEDA